MVSGNHWSCVHINLEAGDGLYADSIGREVPRDFEDTISNFFQAICKAYERNYDFIKSKQVTQEIQPTKSAHKCGYFYVKNFINQRNYINICGVAAIFSAMTMSDLKIATEIIQKQKNDPGYCAWMNYLESSSSLARKLLIKWYIEGEIDLSDISLDRAEENL